MNLEPNFCVLLIMKLFLTKNDLNLPIPYRSKSAYFIQRRNKKPSFDQIWSCYIKESFNRRTVLMKLMSYLLRAIFYYWRFVLNAILDTFPNLFIKMSELLCVKFMPCVRLFIPFQVCIFHDTMFKREEKKEANPNLISQRDEFHFFK